MPRSRGGARSGKPGVAHSNRTDLNGPAQPVRALVGQPYGQAVAQEAAQQAAPLPAVPGAAAPPAAPAAPPAPALPPRAPMVPPAGLLDASRRPAEPVTTGIELGPGAGPEALGFGDGGVQRASAVLRGAYLATPTESVRELIEALEEQGR